MLNQLIQFWLSVFPLKFIQKIHRLEWIEVRLKFLPFAYKLCCYFSFFTWQHCQGLWEEEFSLLSGHNVRLFMNILSFFFFSCKGIWKLGKHADRMFWDDTQSCSIWVSREGRDVLQPDIFNLCADSRVNTWLEQPAALPLSWLVVPSAQQFVPEALQFAHVDRLTPLPTSSLFSPVLVCSSPLSWVALKK